VLSERRGGIEFGGATSQRRTRLAMNLLLLLALAVPLSCLALVSLLALLGVMTLGGVIYVLGTVRGHRPQWPSVEPANRPTRSVSTLQQRRNLWRADEFPERAASSNYRN
jgi:hypothetical protein